MLTHLCLEGSFIGFSIIDVPFRTAHNSQLHVYLRDTRPWTKNLDLLVTLPLCYGLCLMTRCSIMLEKPGIFSKMLLDCCKLVLLNFRYHSLFKAIFLDKIESKPIPLDKKQPHTWIVLGCFTFGTMQDSWNRSSFHLRTSFQTCLKVGIVLHQRR